MMAVTLPFAESLTHLNLSHNNVRDRGVRKLEPALPHCRKLEALDLSDNAVSNDGVETLCAGRWPPFLLDALPFMEARLPFMETMLPFIEAILPFMEAMLPFHACWAVLHTYKDTRTYTNARGHSRG